MKNKKGVTGALIAIMVSCVIGVIILGVLFQFLTGDAVTVRSVAHEQHTLNALNQTRTTYPDLANNAVIVNLTGTATAACNQSLSDGLIMCSPKAASTGAYVNLSYDYYPTSYVKDNTGRLIVGYVPIILVVIIFVFMAGYIGLKQ